MAQQKNKEPEDSMDPPALLFLIVAAVLIRDFELGAAVLPEGLSIASEP